MNCFICNTWLHLEDSTDLYNKYVCFSCNYFYEKYVTSIKHYSKIIWSLSDSAAPHLIYSPNLEICHNYFKDDWCVYESCNFYDMTTIEEYMSATTKTIELSKYNKIIKANILK